MRASTARATILRLACAVASALVLPLASWHVANAGAVTGPDPADASGTLTVAGPLSGVAEIDFVFNPAGSYTATITVDGDQVVSEPVTKGSAHLYLDTTQLADGAHTVVVAIGDSLETATAWSGSVQTLNAPRGGIPAIAGQSEVGGTLIANAGAWLPAPTALAYQWQRCTGGGACAPIDGATGSSYRLTADDVNSQLDVEVTASDASGSTIATSSLSATVIAPTPSVARGPANGSDACPAAQLDARIGGGSSQRVRLGEAAVLSGRLDCGGAPVAGASVDIALAPASGDSAVAHAQVQTGVDGSFSYSVPPGPSRDITITYDAYEGAGSPAAVATLSLRVTPTITLEITPQRTTNGHTVRFAGRVSGGYIGHGGLPLEIEYREGSRWMVYTEVLAEPATGRYRWRYTFERTTQSINYTFRVAIPPSGVAGYPYAPAASPVRRVHVDP